MSQQRDVFRLDGRSALVTGAGSGLGEAIARAFSAAGAAVLVTDIDKDAAVATAESISAAGGVAQPFVLDVRDSAAANEAAAAAAELGGGALHILVNNAGAIAPAMFADLAEENFRRIVDIHLVGAFVCSQAALPHLPVDGTGRSVFPSFHWPSTMRVVACSGSPRSWRSTMLVSVSIASAPIIRPF